MGENLTFSNVCHRLGLREYDRGKIPDDIKLFLELAALFFAPAAAATAGAAGAAAGAVSIASVITTISQKGKVIDAAKRVFELLRKKVPSYDEKYQSMQDAYTILWVASFFDAFEKTVPQPILKKISLSAAEKEKIAGSFTQNGIPENERIDPEVMLPDSVYSIDKVYDRLKKVYTDLTNRLRSFIDDLAFSEESCEKDIRTLDAKLSELPQKALNTFKDQYLTLCTHFGEFAAFIQQNKEREHNIQIETQFAKAINLLNSIDDKTDKGFQKLSEAMLSLSNVQREQEVKAIIDHIKGSYTKAIKRPIIDAKNEEHLSFPSIEEAFVPQHYKLLEYASTDMHLELEEQWKSHKPQKDMLDFWIRYFIDPRNITRLILILGDPGGGKSLLTKMISASVFSDAELVIRIPLRDYSDQLGEMGIEKIICNQIAKDGDASEPIHTFKWFIGNNPSRPATIILDGYDEIQQATGLAYPKLLNTISDFQENCREENRPVRVIVTSRRTLIDKATIPIGTLVMKLQPFEPDQQITWINTWNSKNRAQLLNANLKEFKLPQNNKDIKDLAQQPLLLLMLAMFDADFDAGQNALQVALAAKDQEFNRMRLYSDLIRRFIRRELLKGKKGKTVDFDEADSERQQALIDAEMDKLGIAALGMFVREKLYIKVSELRDDFRKLKASVTQYESEKALDAEEIFLGSFFFIHDSRSWEKDETESANRNTTRDKDASFVFLHKTFYEFLTADYILGRLFDYIIVLATNKSSFQKRLYVYENNLNAIDPQLYMSLCGSPLCAEPEITSMISEWWSQKLKAVMQKEETGIPESDLLAIINDIINKHTELIRAGKLTANEEQSLISNCPLPQRNALYILNLITLMVLLNGTWTIDLTQWHFLAQYIKLFSPIPREKPISESDDKIEPGSLKNTILDPSEELPLRFMTLFELNCNDNRVEIRFRDNPMDLVKQSPVEARTEVYRFLQDHISDKLYSLHSLHVTSDEKLTQTKKLADYDHTLSVEQQIRELRSLLSHDTVHNLDVRDYLASFEKMITNGIEDVDIVIQWLDSIRETKMVFGLPNMDVQNITRLLLSYCIKTKNRKWNEVLVLWLDICVDKIDNDELLSPLINFNNLLRLTGYAFYKCVQYLEKDTEMIYKQFLFHRKNNQYPFLSMSLNEIRTQYPIIKESPLWTAGFLKLLHFVPQSMKKDINYKPLLLGITTTIIEQYDINDPQTWHEMPCLLRECISFGEITTIPQIIHKVSLNHEKIFSKELIEYIGIADTIGLLDFLTEIYNGIRPMISYNAYCMKLAINLSFILISHNAFSQISEFAYWLVPQQYGSIWKTNPVSATKLWVILYQNNLFPPDIDKQHILSHILFHIDFIYQQSPQTAIEFFQFIHTLPSNETQPIIVAIQSIITLARMNGQTEEVEQLKKLIE